MPYKTPSDAKTKNTKKQRVFKTYDKNYPFMKNESVLSGGKRYRCTKAPECRTSDLSASEKENWIEVSKPASVVE
jgi:hypothetical protein